MFANQSFSCICLCLLCPFAPPTVPRSIVRTNSWLLHTVAFILYRHLVRNGRPLRKASVFLLSAPAAWLPITRQYRSSGTLVDALLPSSILPYGVLARCRWLSSCGVLVSTVSFPRSTCSIASPSGPLASTPAVMYRQRPRSGLFLFRSTFWWPLTYVSMRTRPALRFY